MKIAFLRHGLDTGGILTVEGTRQCIEMAKQLSMYADGDVVAVSASIHSCKESMLTICKMLSNVTCEANDRHAHWPDPGQTHSVLLKKHPDAALIIIVTHMSDLRAGVAYFREMFGSTFPPVPFAHFMEGYLIDTEQKTIVQLEQQLAAH